LKADKTNFLIIQKQNKLQNTTNSNNKKRKEEETDFKNKKEQAAERIKKAAEVRQK